MNYVFQRDYYTENTEWELVNVTYDRQEKFYACCEDAPYVQVSWFCVLSVMD